LELFSQMGEKLGDGRGSMVISKKKLIIVVSMLFAGSALAMPTMNCGCKTTTIKVAECQQSKVQSPSWWGWLTNNKSSQLHFFQLIELLHTTDDDVKNNTAAIAQRDDKTS